MKTIYSISICILTAFLVLGLVNSSFAQNVGISTSGSYDPYDAAILDLDAGNVGNYRGLLPPRMTTTQRNLFDNQFSVVPNTLAGAEGMMIYNTTTEHYEMFVFTNALADNDLTNAANWAWKYVATEDDLGGGSFIDNKFGSFTIAQTNSEFWISGRGTIEGNLKVDGTATLGSYATIADYLTVGSDLKVENGIVVGDIVTATPGNGNILMTVDDSWIGTSATEERIVFDKTGGAENIKVYPTKQLQVLIDAGSNPNSGIATTAMIIENEGASSGVGLRLLSSRGSAPGVGATREAGFIDFENTDGSTATLGRLGVTNAAGDNSQGAFQISLRSGGSLDERFLLESNGDLTIDGKFTSNGIKETSDGRFKKNINAISNALSTVMNLEGVTYNWRTDEFPNKSFTDRMEYGVIAQQIEKFVPELVDTDEEGYKAVQYSHMVPLLIEAIKEQQSIINSQSQEIGVLKASVEAISQHINTAEK